MSDFDTRPFDEESIRTLGRPVICLIGAGGLSAIDPAAFVIERIGDDLCRIIGFEHDYDVVFADRATLKRRGFEGQAAWDAGEANTRQIAPIIPTAQDLVKERDFCFESDRLVPSMFADLETWARLSAEVGPDLYVAPVSDTFALVGMAGDDRIDEIRSGAAADHAGMAVAGDPRNRAVSPDVYRFRDGGWRRA